MKVKDRMHLTEAIDLLLNDIDEYLKGGDSYDRVTTQSLIRIHLIFRGWIMKNWLNVNEYQPRKMHTLNKIIVNHSVKFYSKAQKNRNEVRHDPIKCKEFVKDWYQKVVEMVKNDNRPELNKYVRM